MFAYVDIFAFYRADVLEAALDGRVASTDFTVNQMFLTATLVYILIPALMVIGRCCSSPRSTGSPTSSSASCTWSASSSR
ncbi:MAG: hypothetical protein WAK18_00330 [Nocardioidaceae bacterium]